MDKEITATKIAIFRKREIRKTVHKNEWWFVVNDVVLALTDLPNVPDYIKKMRKRDNELGKGWEQFVTPLSVRTSGGNQKLSCAGAGQGTAGGKGVKPQNYKVDLACRIIKD